MYLALSWFHYSVTPLRHPMEEENLHRPVFSQYCKRLTIYGIKRPRYVYCKMCQIHPTYPD